MPYYAFPKNKPKRSHTSRFPSLLIPIWFIWLLLAPLFLCILLVFIFRPLLCIFCLPLNCVLCWLEFWIWLDPCKSMMFWVSLILGLCLFLRDGSCGLGVTCSVRRRMRGPLECCAHALSTLRVWWLDIVSWMRELRKFFSGC